jgi:hypothetical protein
LLQQRVCELSVPERRTDRRERPVKRGEHLTRRSKGYASFSIGCFDRDRYGDLPPDVSIAEAGNCSDDTVAPTVDRPVSEGSLEARGLLARNWKFDSISLRYNREYYLVKTIR